MALQTRAGGIAKDAGKPSDFDNMRSRDIFKQGFTKHAPAVKDPAKKRIREIEDALAGKRGYQSPWAISLLKEELNALKGMA